MKITHLDLFSGIGGFSLAADWVWGKENVEHIFCEIEEFPQKVLRKHWPESKIFSDIKELTGEEIITNTKHFRPPQCEVGRDFGKTENNNKEGTNNPKQLEGMCGRECSQGLCEERHTKRDSDWTLLTGGFPCQPYSVAGKQRGAEDDRALWPEMLRVISEVKPSWIIGENVGGFVNMGLDDCLSDLAGEGYDCQPLVIPACAVNAPHRRDRVWIVANSRHGSRWNCEYGRPRGYSGRKLEEVIREPETVETPRSGEAQKVMAGSEQQRGCSRDTQREDAEATWESSSYPWRDKRGVGIWDAEPDVGRVANGIPARVDRLKGLGNAIVPQVAAVIMQAIKEIEET